jgi:hypothetical protein
MNSNNNTKLNQQIFDLFSSILFLFLLGFLFFVNPSLLINVILFYTIFVAIKNICEMFSQSINSIIEENKIYENIIIDVIPIKEDVDMNKDEADNIIIDVIPMKEDKDGNENTLDTLTKAIQSLQDQLQKTNEKIDALTSQPLTSVIEDDFINVNKENENDEDIDEEEIKN